MEETSLEILTANEGLGTITQLACHVFDMEKTQYVCVSGHTEGLRTQRAISNASNVRHDWQDH